MYGLRNISTRPGKNPPQTLTEKSDHPMLRGNKTHPPKQF